MEERLGLGYYHAYFGNGLARQNTSGYFANRATNILFSDWETNVMHEL